MSEFAMHSVIQMKNDSWIQYKNRAYSAFCAASIKRKRGDLK